MNNTRRMSEKSVKVLSLIAEGHSYGQIVDGHSDITYHDIFHAAEEALQLHESASDYKQRLAQIKTRYPMAYEPWTAEDDSALSAMHATKNTVAQMATQFRRQPSAIRSRLLKLNLRAHDDLR